MEKKPSITTKTGDKGQTQLFSGEFVSKDSPRTDAYGDIDELNSILGVARNLCRNEEVAGALLEIQRDLFIVAAELATGEEHVGRLENRVDEEMLGLLESRREAIEAVVAMPSGFVIPGGTVAAAHIDHARTVARRCERKVVKLVEGGLVGNQHLLVWMNRLSDYLWLLARLEEDSKTFLKDD
ncbi:MAG: cob(I)yrinic acid a,c-diamide adenosyltransferase [Verrucomicrobia bacterium]|nr:cob(I)yrinic acid a,c-diamide adenosyltransferase [Verrucomicrobiota bacterium]